jgi:hypothetical protein
MTCLNYTFIIILLNNGNQFELSKQKMSKTRKKAKNKVNNKYLQLKFNVGGIFIIIRVTIFVSAHFCQYYLFSILLYEKYNNVVVWD